MKKTYATPTVLVTNDAVRETKGGSQSVPDTSGNGILQAPGALGFNL